MRRNIEPEDLSKKQLCKLAHEVTKDSFRVHEENELLLAEVKRLREPIKCKSSFCDTLIHRQSYCPDCKKLWET